MASFITSVFDIDSLKKSNKNEICFLGRSNVGKSTLINALANQKIAFIAKKPGKTRSLNFYDFGKYNLIDLPGYGYATINMESVKSISVLIVEYLQHRSELKGIIQICDLSILTEKDLAVFKEYTQNYDNYLVCLNKCDRYSKSQQQKYLNVAKDFFQIPEENFLMISGKTKTNILKLNNIIFKWTKK